MRPTILADVTNDMRVAQEEIFGPVVCFIKFKDEDEVIKMANDSEYGLGARSGHAISTGPLGLQEVLRRDVCG